MKIDIFCEGDIVLPFKEITQKKIKKDLTNICKYLELDDEYITLILTDNNFIHDINNRFRKKDCPTDVISFVYSEDNETPFPDESDEKEPLGDIYLSLEKAYTQSREYKVIFHDEIRRLIVHGVLHLIGYDHELSNNEVKRMRKKEEEVLSAIS